MTERLISAAIERNGQIWKGHKSHWELRDARGDLDASRRQMDDNEGFWTSNDRFVTRDEARKIGLASGQLPPMWARGGRELLSSDINWDAKL